MNRVSRNTICANTLTIQLLAFSILIPAEKSTAFPITVLFSFRSLYPHREVGKRVRVCLSMIALVYLCIGSPDLLRENSQGLIASLSLLERATEMRPWRPREVELLSRLTQLISDRGSFLQNPYSCLKSGISWAMAVDLRDKGPKSDQSCGQAGLEEIL